MARTPEKIAGDLLEVIDDRASALTDRIKEAELDSEIVEETRNVTAMVECAHRLRRVVAKSG